MGSRLCSGLMRWVPRRAGAVGLAVGGGEPGGGCSGGSWVCLMSGCCGCL